MRTVDETNCISNVEPCVKELVGTTVWKPIQRVQNVAPVINVTKKINSALSSQGVLDNQSGQFVIAEDVVSSSSSSEADDELITTLAIWQPSTFQQIKTNAQVHNTQMLESENIISPNKFSALFDYDDNEIQCSNDCNEKQKRISWADEENIEIDESNPSPKQQVVQKQKSPAQKIYSPSKRERRNTNKYSP
ncbi:hypothetical protein M5689_025317 [Euphorbia peplus]|nr:hypothetical protein M5689_025317 [Euphorbia peplus]